MPSGRTHDRITLWGLPWIIILGVFGTRRGELILILAIAYLFSGLTFGPDLDIYSIQYRRWGILRWIWLPYQSCLKHRSLLSHGFLIGTVLRLVYLTTIMIVVAILGAAITQLILGVSWNWQQFTLNFLKWLQKEGAEEAIALLVGSELGAMSHSLSDYLGSTLLKVSKSKKRRKINKRR